MTAPPPLARSALELTTALNRRDSLLLPRSLPTFHGPEAQDLTCGKCSDVIGSGVTPGMARSRYPEGERLVIRCICGALNVISRAP